ncbi:unnamed protein product [Lathyrus oleraceus]|uniref:F-box domain-containing protein n=1 Tax=Pisum sativum TaxID=3888 RepID=A0A9D4YNA3_PEA|nr:putative F-box protein At1g12190 [Pisum sativum]XP_050902769.1 putative F-box protein At1g12190 [Pisum sativum]KAI5441648.1 hypothetical protein KIW84_010923 [Pisum sativum]
MLQRLLSDGRCTSFVQELVEELHTRFSSKHISAPVQLPEDIIAEVLKRIPVKMLVQCKSVSKSWTRILMDPIFINMQFHFHSPTRIVLSNVNHTYSISVSLPLNPNPNSVLNTQQLCPPPCEHGFCIKDYCNGLFVITVRHEKSIILWNPSISQYRVLPPSPFFENHCSRGFSRDICAIGYDSSKDDYKMITSTFFYGARIFELLSLNSNSWKQLPDAESAPYHMETFLQRPVSINGSIFWIASDKASYKHMIMRFDVCQERFSLLPALPDVNVRNVCWIGDINQSLCTYYLSNNSYFHIWSTRDAFNWVKLITVSMIPEPNPRTPSLYYVPLCFTENGELLISLRGYGIFDRRRGLAAYDPNEQSYRRFVLEENTYWLEEAVYSDSLFFPKEPSDQACSHSSSGFLKKMLLRFSHTIFSHLACNATSD